MVSLGLPKELEQVTTWHELHDDIDWIVVQAHSQYLHNVRMVEVAVREGERGQWPG